jgi:nitroimidazol reductase NimA-like FMN-containing flavoprotein (pyridoxamine 5'-phosphate oxidase superfamily)
MQKNQLSHEETMSLVEKEKVLFLGASGDDFPYVVPINYVLLNGKIYLHCRRAGGRKLDCIRKNPKVCVAIAEAESYRTGETPCQTSTLFKSAIGFGRARALNHDDPADRSLMEAVLLKFGEKFVPGLINPTIPPEKLAATGVVEIDVEKWTGKGRG